MLKSAAVGHQDNCASFVTWEPWQGPNWKNCLQWMCFTSLSSSCQEEEFSAVFCICTLVLFLFLYEALSSLSKFFTIKDNKTLQYFIKWHPELFLQTLRHKSDWEQDSNKEKHWGKFTSFWSIWTFAIRENLESIHCNKKLAGT